MGIGKDGFSDWSWCFLRLEVIGLVREREFDLGWREDRRVFGDEGLGLKRGDRE